MSIHPGSDIEQPLRTDDSWMTPEQVLRVEKIHLETMLNKLESERRLDRNAPFDEQLHHGVRMVQERLRQIAED